MQLNCTDIVIISIDRMTKPKHENQDIRVLNFFRLQFANSNDVLMYQTKNGRQTVQGFYAQFLPFMHFYCTPISFLYHPRNQSR